MKTKFFFILIICSVALIYACSGNDLIDDLATQSDKDKPVQCKRTVLVYMAGRNNLTDSLNADLKEMKEGSYHIGDDDCLLVFVRHYNGGEKPWLARIRQGQVTDSLSVVDLGITTDDYRASNPGLMFKVLHYAYSHYPATKDYGLVLWGHGSGWLLQDSIPDTRAFGVDNGQYRYSSIQKWINTYTLRQLLSEIPHLRFIMADCCHFMCLENLYEMRNIADYVIGSPAEVPSQGAPYDKVVPAMFSDGSFYTSIVDSYYESVDGRLPLSVADMQQMNNLARATREVMKSVRANIGNDYADMHGIVHYANTYEKEFMPEYNMFYDAGDFIRHYAPEDAYIYWKESLDQAIIYKRMATMWKTCLKWNVFYTDFKLTAEKYHGVSMFVPQNPNIGDYKRLNENVKRMSWYVDIFR